MWSSRVVGRVLLIGLVCAALHPVRVIAQSGSEWGEHSPVPGRSDSARPEDGGEFLPEWHVATALATVTVVVENHPEWWWARPVGYAAVVGLAVSVSF